MELNLPSDVKSIFNTMSFSLNFPSHVPEIEGLINKTVTIGGKRFRPLIVFLTGGMLGLSPKGLEPYARAVELVHAATLAHDDVIDEATKRRSKPTINAVKSNVHAVLSGDYLLARTMHEVAKLGNLNVIRDMSQILMDLVEGEWLQLEARKNIDVSRSLLEKIAEKKTSSLMIWSFQTPGRVADLGTDELELLKSIGQHLGVAFQLIDDCIDYDENGEKGFATDLKEGLVNSVTLEMLTQFPKLRAPLKSIILSGEISSVPWDEQMLTSALTSVRLRSRARLTEAMTLLQTLWTARNNNNSEYYESLRKIFLILGERTY